MTVTPTPDSAAAAPAAPAAAAAAPGAPAAPAAKETVAPRAPWSIDRAKALYNIDGWGDGFFDVNAAGHVVVRPDKDAPDQVLDLFELAHDLEAQGVQLPVLLRFSEILK